MRDILFRGKPVDGGEFQVGGIVHQTDFYGDKCDKYFIIDGTTTQDYDIGYECQVIPDTVGQFTGASDKNGKRIFEGDIVLDRLDGTDFVGFVVYDGNSCRFIAINQTDTLFDILRPEMEVIGNIHDNPDLLS